MDQTGCSTPKRKLDETDFATPPRETDAAEFLTPTRKQARASLQGSALRGKNDDGAEKHSRQQEILQELHSQHTESPGTPGNRSIGLVPPTFTDVQLAEHYTSCIRLSTENKINVKNAFNLHLIDLIRKVLQTEDGSTNFQVASCTLEASAKIYACRVDHVHSEVLKIAGELGISSRLRKRELIKGRVKKEDPDQPAATTKGRGKRTKSRGSSTLVRNVKTITIEKVETIKAIDPLQEYIRAHSTCGTADCFVINHIYSFSDRGEVIYLNTKWQHQPINDIRVKAPIDYLQTCLNIHGELCYDPGLLYMWDDSSVEEERGDFPGLMDTSYGFHCPNASVAVTEEQGPSLPYVGNSNDKDDQCGHVFEDPCPERPEDLIKDGISDLVKYIAPVRQDYSYFTNKFSCVPHGPEQWRLRKAKVKTTGPVRGRKKAEKVAPHLDFSNVRPDYTNFVRLKREPVLDKATLNSWSKSKHTLALSEMGEDVNLSTLLLLDDREIPELEIPPIKDVAKDRGHASSVGGLPPDIHEDSNMLVDNVGDAGPSVPVEPLPPLPPPPAPAPAPAPAPQFKPAVPYEPKFVPGKIPKFQFSFKRFDMKDMKQAMWRTMTGHKDNKENDPSSANVPDKGAITKYTFRKLYDNVGPQLNRINRASINVPVAFVALLHLAAEKEFFVESVKGLKDLKIKLKI